MEKSYAVIVVTYNRKELLHECLEALLAQKFSAFDILVVDNGILKNTRNSACLLRRGSF